MVFADPSIAGRAAVSGIGDWQLGTGSESGERLVVAELLVLEAEVSALEAVMGLFFGPGSGV